MWAHYADKHCGVVLEFLPDAPRDSILLAARNVAYVKERPLLYRSAEEMVRHFYFIAEEESSQQIFNSIIFTKSLEWRYESKIRLAVPKLIANDKPFETMRFYPNELISVILGCRMAENQKNEIVSMARQVNPRVAILQARTAKREYSLEIVREH